MQSSRNVLFAYLQERSRWAHIGNIFLSGGIEHGSKGNELLQLHLLYLLGVDRAELVFTKEV